MTSARRDAQMVSIVIPCWNAARRTRECLGSLYRWTTHPYELIVVDDGSRDDTPAVLREFRSLGCSLDPAQGRPRHFRIITHKINLGFAPAINRGMDAARGAYILWLNNDTILTPRWLEGLWDHAEARGRAVGAVGPYYSPALSGSSLDRIAQAVALRNRGLAREQPALYGFCFLLPRRAFRRVGFLDESFAPAFAEDIDYCLRLTRAGYKLLLAQDVLIHHREHGTFKANRIAYRRLREAHFRRLQRKWGAGNVPPGIRQVLTVAR